MEATLARELYQEHILDLFKHPHNLGKLATKTHEHREYNALCGDDITLQLQVHDGKITSVKFFGRGCAISMASASLVTDWLKGKTLEEASRLKAEEVIKMLEIPIGPVRMKCALLPHTCAYYLVRGKEKPQSETQLSR